MESVTAITPCDKVVHNCRVKSIASAAEPYHCAGQSILAAAQCYIHYSVNNKETEQCRVMNTTC